MQVTLKLLDTQATTFKDEQGRMQTVFPKITEMPSKDTRYVKDADGFWVLQTAYHGFQKVQDKEGDYTVIEPGTTFRGAYLTYDKDKEPWKHEFWMNHSRMDRANNPNSQQKMFKIMDYAKEKNKNMDRMMENQNIMAKFIDIHPEAYTSEQILCYAFINGIDTKQNMKSITHDVMIQAQSDPQAFELAMIDSHLVQKRIVKEAAQAEVLLFTNNRWTWGHNQKPICTVPTGIDKFQHLETHLFTTPQGSVDLTEINARLTQSVGREKVEAENTELDNFHSEIAGDQFQKNALQKEAEEKLGKRHGDLKRFGAKVGK